MIEVEVVDKLIEKLIEKVMNAYGCSYKQALNEVYNIFRDKIYEL